MTQENGFSIDPSWKGVVKWGGLSLFASGIVPILFVLSVIAMKQTLPVPAEEALENPAGPTALFTLTAIGELLLLPGVLGLYFSLKDVDKTRMFMATVLWAMCVPMFLASRGLIFSLSLISDRYMDTADPAMKAAYLASAELALETQSIYAYMGLILLAVASIIIGLVMLKGGFSKRMGYVVIAAGIFTLFTPVGVIMDVPIILPFIGIVLGAIWQTVVGFKLYKLGQGV